MRTLALHRRIRKRFGRTAILLRRVDSEPERVLTFRSPRFERGDEIILGRNVLNRLRLLLDGPAAVTQVLE